MALGQLPPWLNVQPENFLQAIQLGDAAGARAAEINSRAAQAGAANRLQGQELQLRAALAGMDSEKELAARDLAAQQFAAEMMMKERGLGLDQQREGRLERYGEERMGLMDAKNQIDAARAESRNAADAARIISANDKLELARERFKFDQDKAAADQGLKGDPLVEIMERGDDGSLERKYRIPMSKLAEVEASIAASKPAPETLELQSDPRALMGVGWLKGVPAGMARIENASERKLIPQSQVQAAIRAGWKLVERGPEGGAASPRNRFTYDPVTRRTYATNSPAIE